MNLTLYRSFITFLCFNLFSLTSINAHSSNNHISAELVAVNKSVHKLIDTKKNEVNHFATKEDIMQAAKDLGAAMTFYLEEETDIANNSTKLQSFINSTRDKMAKEISRTKLKLTSLKWISF